METTNKDRIYQGLEECASCEKIPLSLLLLAKHDPECPRGLAGIHPSGRVYYATAAQGENTFEKWLKANAERLDATDDEDLSTWNLREKRAKALLAEFKLMEMRGEVVSKQTLKDLLDRIANALTSLINGKIRQELPARFKLTPDQIQQLDSMLNELFAVIQKPIDQWNKK